MSAPADMDALIQAGLALEQEGSEPQAIAYFQHLLEQYPDHPRVAFELAGAYDFAGYEAETIPHYYRAIELGLDGEDALRVQLQLGSSLRNVGKYTEAVKLLKQACEKYPDHAALRAFYGLALVSAGQSRQAVIELLDVLTAHPEMLDGYQRALGFYTEELRRT